MSKIQLSMTQASIASATILMGGKFDSKKLEYNPLTKAFTFTAAMSVGTVKAFVTSPYFRLGRIAESTRRLYENSIKNHFVPTEDPLVISDRDGMLINGRLRMAILAELTDLSRTFVFKVHINCTQEQASTLHLSRKRTWTSLVKLIYGVSPSSQMRDLTNSFEFLTAGNVSCPKALSVFDFQRFLDWMEDNGYGEDLAGFIDTWRGYAKGRGRSHVGLIDVFFKIWMVKGEKVGADVLAKFFAHQGTNPYMKVYETFYGKRNSARYEVAIAGRGRKKHPLQETTKRQRVIDMLLDIDPAYAFLLGPVGPKVAPATASKKSK